MATRGGSPVTSARSAPQQQWAILVMRNLLFGAGATTTLYDVPAVIAPQKTVVFERAPFEPAVLRNTPFRAFGECPFYACARRPSSLSNRRAPIWMLTRGGRRLCSFACCAD